MTVQYSIVGSHGHSDLICEPVPQLLVLSADYSPFYKLMYKHISLICISSRDLVFASCVSSLVS